jgi:hypothetical protein
MKMREALPQKILPMKFGFAYHASEITLFPLG